jgi:hypothetical protein
VLNESVNDLNKQFSTHFVSCITPDLTMMILLRWSHTPTRLMFLDIQRHKTSAFWKVITTRVEIREKIQFNTTHWNTANKTITTTYFGISIITFREDQRTSHYQNVIKTTAKQLTYDGLVFCCFCQHVQLKWGIHSTNVHQTQFV